MQTDWQNLNEITITGYGTSRNRWITGSVSSNSESGNIPDEEIAEEDEVTSKEAEKKLYSELMQLNSLRRNFSDVGFWKPELFTDSKGRVQFSATFPDNITRWDAIIYAMNRKLQTGTYRQAIRSYKPLMAELKTPRFLVTGDTSNLTSIIRNYTDSKQLKGTGCFTAGTGIPVKEEIEMQALHTSSLAAEAASTDSLTVRYLFTRDDGYEDGEEHVIPVLPQGVEIAKGSLSILQYNKPLVLKAQPDEEMQVSVSSNQLAVYSDVVVSLEKYQYLCNEQMASKLIGFLAQKKIAAYKGQKFTNDKNIRLLVNRLLANQNTDMSWGWWGREESSSAWMTAHILRALALANNEGYLVRLRLEKLNDLYIPERIPYREVNLSDIDIYRSLRVLEVPMDYVKVVRYYLGLINQYEMEEEKLYNAYYCRSYLREKLMLWEMLPSGSNVADSLRPYLEKDVLGGIYCDDDRQKPYWSHSSLENTLTAYRIAKQEPGLQDLLAPLQISILHSRNEGWNTYMASSALTTVLNDLLTDIPCQDTSNVIELQQEGTTTRAGFPYNTRIAPGETLTLTNKEKIPLILSTYTVKQVTEANAGEAFEVHTAFEGGKDHLVAGVPVNLKVTLKVKQASAQYVMLEVPIPASCSYGSKPMRNSWHEVHREYFKEKTAIFFEDLPEGEYHLQIPLLPRYTGTYSLNPAKVELMYLPVVNANNSLRRINVSEN